jgi:hypothetical protein
LAERQDCYNTANRVAGDYIALFMLLELLYTCANRLLLLLLLLLRRPRKVVSVDAMDATADWATRVEELRFDPLDPSDPTWHRCAVMLFAEERLLSRQATAGVCKAATVNVVVLILLCSEGDDVIWCASNLASSAECKAPLLAYSASAVAPR